MKCRRVSDPPSGTVVDPGATITYTLIAEHESGGVIAGATAEDDLSDVLRYASVVVPLPAELVLNGDTVVWTVPPIPVGGAVQVSFRVTVRAGAEGANVVNLAAPTSTGGHCSPCRTAHTVRVRSVQPTEPPRGGGVSTSGTDTGTPLRWAVALLAAGVLLLMIAGARRRVGTLR